MPSVASSSPTESGLPSSAFGRQSARTLTLFVSSTPESAMSWTGHQKSSSVRTSYVKNYVPNGALRASTARRYAHIMTAKRLDPAIPRDTSRYRNREQRHRLNFCSLSTRSTSETTALQPMYGETPCRRKMPLALRPSLWEGCFAIGMGTCHPLLASTFGIGTPSKETAAIFRSE